MNSSRLSQRRMKHGFLLQELPDTLRSRNQPFHRNDPVIFHWMKGLAHDAQDRIGARLTAISMTLLLFPLIALGQPTPLTKSLTQRPLESLVADVMEKGDSKRGAVFFHQPLMQCSQCHQQEMAARLGPSLAGYDQAPDRNHLVESILEPSRAIHRGFETVIVVDDRGRQTIGFLREENDDEMTLVDIQNGGAIVAFDKSKIEERSLDKQSSMPGGLVDQLQNEGQFFDLARYVIEIAEHGPDRADELKPPSN